MLRFNDEVAAEEGPEGGPPGPSIESQTIRPTPYSEAENTILRAAFKSGDKDKVAGAHAQIAATRSGEKTHEAPAGQGSTPTPQMVQPPQEVNTTTEDLGSDPIVEFSAQTGGVVDGANLELLGKHTEPWARQNDEIMSRYPNDLDAGATALVEHWAKGEERVLRDLYRGSETAFASGIKEIDAALDLLPNGAVLREALNEHRALANLATHQHVLTLARMVTKKLGKK